MCNALVESSPPSSCFRWPLHIDFRPVVSNGAENFPASVFRARSGMEDLRREQCGGLLCLTLLPTIPLCRIQNLPDCLHWDVHQGFACLAWHRAPCVMNLARQTAPRHGRARCQPGRPWCIQIRIYLYLVSVASFRAARRRRSRRGPSRAWLCTPPSCPCSPISIARRLRIIQRSLSLALRPRVLLAMHLCASFPVLLTTLPLSHCSELNASCSEVRMLRVDVPSDLLRTADRTTSRDPAR